MPQESELYTITLKNRAGTMLKIQLVEVFKTVRIMGGLRGFRLKADGKWAENKRHPLHSLQGAFQAAMELIREQLASPVPGRGRKPRLAPGSPVRVLNGNASHGVPWTEMTRTATPPFRGYDGRWYVFVRVADTGMVQVAVDELEVIKALRGTQP